MKQCPICSRSFPTQEQFCSVHGLPLIQGLSMETGDKGKLSGVVLEDRYRLGGVIGAGGMGVVYEAEQLRVGRRCAVKVLHGGQAADPRVRMRFFREVRATARVRNPNVVEIIDFGEDATVGTYMVMEYLGGASLTRIIRDESPMSLRGACAIMSQLCAALGTAHAQGLIHRDLKPSNIRRLPSGLIKVLDFGLVKAVDDEHACSDVPSVTTDNMIVGTPWYMSPEHCQGRLLDGRADIYSLGVIFYEMLVGRLPFDGAHPLEVIQRQLNEPMPEPSHLDPPIILPQAAEMLLRKALDKNRESRFQSVHELADGIHELAEEQRFTIARYTTQPVEPSSKPSRPLKTMQWIGTGAPEPTMEPTPELRRLHALAVEREEWLIDQVSGGLLKAFPRYSAVEPKALRDRIGRAVRGAIAALVTEPVSKQGLAFEIPDDDFDDGQLSLTDVVMALWLGYTAWRPLILETSGAEQKVFADLADQFDRRMLPYFFRLYDRYIAVFQGQLQRLNETITRRNEALHEMHNTLKGEVQDVSRQLAEVERLKARVTECVSVGLMLTEKGSRRVLLWNKALERLSGIEANQVVGRTVDEIAHLVDGIPIEEFSEQVAFRGEVGLRKLRLTFRKKEQRIVYLQGQPFFGPDGDRLGTLFTLEDVTEREQVIESLGRYLSKDLVTRILSSAGAVQPEGERRQVVILAARLQRLPEVIDGLSQAEVIRLLNRYVRAVSRAVFQRGGTIERITPDGLLAYFAHFGENSASAIEAALELARRLEQIVEVPDDAPPAGLELSAGLHVGQVMVLNVGDDRLMVQTVVGEATRTAEALGTAAAAGEILISADLAETIGDTVSVEPGPELPLAGRPAPLRSFRVISRLTFDIDPEPITLVGNKKDL